MGHTGVIAVISDEPTRPVVQNVSRLPKTLNLFNRLLSSQSMQLLGSMIVLQHSAMHWTASVQ